MSENSIIRANGQGLQLTTMADYREFALCVAKSGMAPRSLDTPEKVMVAVQMGAEIGLTPMQSLQSIAVVNGTATIYGDTALGLVRNSGLLEWIKEDVEGTLNTNLDKVDNTVRAVCTVQRVGDPEPVTRTFCVAEAKMAGLWGKAGPWRTHWPRMLKYKARAFTLRDTFPDVLKGLHVNEEMIGERIAVASSDVTVSSQTLLLEGDNDSGIRTEEQRDQPVPERQEARGQAGPELHGPGDRDGRAGVGETVGQQNQGRQQDHPEDTAGAEATEPERTAGDTGADGGNQVLSEGALFDDDAGKKYACEVCGTLYKVKPARGVCVAADADDMPCKGKVVDRTKQTT
jgi:hypothetical protein